MSGKKPEILKVFIKDLTTSSLKTEYDVNLLKNSNNDININFKEFIFPASHPPPPLTLNLEFYSTLIFSYLLTDFVLTKQ